ncbi:uncharacterized protein CDAR_285901 [Caerostris darwini]|uniref:Uncharacterized protein n=1 Tax=Caerostris darwini TaxID=1538125 RepID=A0AAV4VZS9_9ARAC|nr:uncharacterized protein CDAR_285901 [Caerostris darwini]
MLSVNSLKQMCLNKVATSCFKAKEMLEVIKINDALRTIIYVGYESVLDSKVSEKISEILPIKSLQDELLRIIRVWKCAAIVWKLIRGIEEVDLADFSWSMGTIDKLETAQTIVENCNIDIKKRFLLACEYSLEDNVRELWELMSSEEKSRLRRNTLPRDAKIWLDIVKRKRMNENWLQKQKRKLCCFAFCTGNSQAVQNLLKNCSVSEKKHKLKKFSENFEVSYDIFLFYISMLDRDTKMNLLRKNVQLTLLSCLDWPWQNLIVDTIHHLRDSVSDYDYFVLLISVMYKIFFKWENFDYVNLFNDIWQNSPVTMKEEAKGHDMYPYIVILLKRGPYVFRNAFARNSNFNTLATTFIECCLHKNFEKFSLS